MTTFTVLFLTISLSFAQKFGHVNSNELLLALPEIKQADSQLGAHQTQLVNKGQQMMKAFESNYQAAMAQVNSGELSQLQIQKKEAELAAEEKDIRAYEVQVQQEIAAKKQELYQPIFDKVQKEIQLVGKEMGYTMIFDTSNGIILYSVQSDDLMSVLKQRLGIQ